MFCGKKNIIVLPFTHIYNEYLEEKSCFSPPPQKKKNLFLPEPVLSLSATIVAKNKNK